MTTVGAHIISSAYRMQYFRRIVQLLVLLLILFIPFLKLYGVDKYAKDSFSYSLAARQISSMGWLRGKGLGLTEKFMAGIDDKDKVVSSISGSPWSINIAGYAISDPLAAITLMQAGSEFYWPFLKSILFLVLLSVFLGRVFCGWLCPYHFLAEINAKIRRFFIRIGMFRPRDLFFEKWTKYLLLAILLGLSFIAGISLYPRIYPPAVIGMEVFRYVFYGTAGFGTFFIVFLLLSELLLFDRWWCRHVCPGGALYSIVGSLRVARMVRVPENCTYCGECDKVCPFNLFPMSDKMGIECDNCGLCRSSCPEDALHYRLISFWKERRMIKGRKEEGNIAEKAGVDG